MDKRGVSIVEIIITVLILSILSGMGVGSYLVWQKQSKLITTSDEVKSVLIRAQQMATAAASSTHWGVHFEADSYVLFSGSFYNEDDPSNLTWHFSGVEVNDPGASFSDGAGGRTADVVFNKFTGLTSNTGTINLILDIDPNIGKEIEVFASGKVD